MSKTTLEQKWPAKEPSLASRMNMLTQSRQIMPDRLAENNHRPSNFAQSQQVIDMNWTNAMDLDLFASGLLLASTTDNYGHFF